MSVTARSTGVIVGNRGRTTRRDTAHLRDRKEKKVKVKECVYSLESNRNFSPNFTINKKRKKKGLKMKMGKKGLKMKMGKKV